jgi:beta-phosphoglucomutase-like phosphatase (HAD superfamily)
MTAAFDAIFFDNDGVLVDSEPLFLKATQEILDSVDIRLAAKDYHDISMRDGRSRDLGL